MPRSELALRLTDGYRGRLLGLRQIALRRAASAWQGVALEDLDRSFELWLAAASGALTEVQARSVALSGGYLAAYLSVETGRRIALRHSDTAALVGKSRDGRLLRDALHPAVITVKQRIAEENPPDVALAAGLARALRTVALDASHAPRAALAESMQAEDQVIGWRRVTAGDACGACLGAATGAIRADDEVLEAHAYCQCGAEPVIARVREHVQRPTGTEIFESKPAEQQNQLLGEEKAELVRSGQVSLPELVAHSPMATEHDHITERPLSALT